MAKRGFPEETTADIRIPGRGFRPGAGPPGNSLYCEHPYLRPGFPRNPILKANLEQLLGQLYNIIACKIFEQGLESNRRLPRQLLDSNPVGPTWPHELQNKTAN